MLYLILFTRSSVQSCHSVVSGSLRPHGLQHCRLPCPSPTPWACSNSIKSVTPFNHFIFCRPLLSFIYLFIYISWKLITLKYCNGSCHSLIRISYGFTCVPHPEPPSHLPPHPIPQGHPSAPALNTLSHASILDWRSVSQLIIYMFQCYSLRSSHPRLLPQSPKICSRHLIFFCVAYRVIVTIFLNSIYMPFCFKSCPASRSFPNESVLCIRRPKSTGVSASASFFPISIQDWFPSGLIGLILQSRGLARVFNTTVQKHPFFSTQFSIVPTHVHITTGKTIALTGRPLLAK